MLEPSRPTVKRLFAVSGNRCAFPKCQNQLIDSRGTVTGKISHIRGRSPGGPRYDPNQSDAERQDFDNLLLLCAIHHDVVDTDLATYSVDRLCEMKRQHEASATRVSEPTDSQADKLIGAIRAFEGATVVISHNQSGGITAGNVNISTVPKPSVTARQVFVNRQSGREYHTRIELAVESLYPPANLRVIVYAPSIRRIDLSPQHTGIVMKGHSGTRQGYAFDNLQQPHGRIFLEIFTSLPETPSIEWDIE